MLKRLKTVSISAGGAWPSSTDPVRQPVSCPSSPITREGAGATTSSDRELGGGPGSPSRGCRNQVVDPSAVVLSSRCGGVTWQGPFYSL